MRRLLAIAATALLAGCAVEQPVPADLVQDGTAAIQRVRDECEGPAFRGLEKAAAWHAKFGKGVWEVSLGGEGGNCFLIGGHVRAADGKTDCSVCVT